MEQSARAGRRLGSLAKSGLAGGAKAAVNSLIIVRMHFLNVLNGAKRLNGLNVLNCPYLIDLEL
jgi:hypothetical protein